MTDAYLCHKCGGLLSPADDPALYHCGCISGWARDWQTPTPVSDLRKVQITALEQRLVFYRRQGRSETTGHIPATIVQLLKLRGASC